MRFRAWRADRSRHSVAGDRPTRPSSASFTNLSHTIRAVLSFNDRAELTNFVADGRAAASADGKSFTKMPWSTPLSDYREFGSHRLMTRGEGIWHAPTGDYSYLRFDLDAISTTSKPRAVSRQDGTCGSS